MLRPGEYIEQEAGKREKSSIGYSDGLPNAHCGLCVFFLPGHGKCKLVKGDIRFDMWCRLFAKRAS